MTPKPYYQDDYVTLYQGDCRQITEWTSADVLITDPPYGISWKRGANPTRGSKAHQGILNDHDTSARDEAHAIWGTRPAALFGSWRAPFPRDVKQTLVWHKPADTGVIGSTTGYRLDTELVFLSGQWPKRPPTRSSVLSSRAGSRSYLNGHPHAKPVPIMSALIEMTEGTIADPFAGSGSTLVAARNLGRRAIGVELDPIYCDLIVSRLAQHTFDFATLKEQENPA